MSDDYMKAAPLCEKHQPNGGTRGMCVICAGESLQHALSRISYACEPPNEMQYSSFDVHMDETAVVAQVVAQAERIRVLEHLVIDAAYTLDKARIWNGMGWTYNPLHPVHYAPMRERLHNECDNIAAIRRRE